MPSGVAMKDYHDTKKIFSSYQLALQVTSVHAKVPILLEESIEIL